MVGTYEALWFAPQLSLALGLRDIAQIQLELRFSGFSLNSVRGHQPGKSIDNSSRYLDFSRHQTSLLSSYILGRTFETHLN